MPSDLFSIGASGVRAARAALDISAQNIANVNTDGYVRRSSSQAELLATTGNGVRNAHSLSGVQITGINRNATDFAAAELRRNTSDAERAAGVLAGLRPIQDGIENAGIFDSITEYEVALKSLASDPVSTAHHASVIGAAGVMTSAFVFGAGQLTAHQEAQSQQAEGSLSALNQAASELAKINLGLSQSRPGTAGQAVLLDERDLQLRIMAEQAGIKTSFDAQGVARVSLSGDGAGTVLVDNTAVSPLAIDPQSDGTIVFTQGGTPVTVDSGQLAGYAVALEANRDALAELDAIALNIINLVNGAQASGVDIDGAAGAPLLIGTGASDIEVATLDERKIVTAAAGEPAGSRDGSVLADLRVAFDEGGVAEGANRLVFDLSTRISAQETTSSALSAIATASVAAYEASAAVDLDQEAANLIRYEQAFQASGRVMQVATELIDTILGIR